MAIHLRRDERENVRKRLAGSGLREFEWVADDEGSRWVCLDAAGTMVELFLAGDSDVHAREYARRVTVRIGPMELPFISPEDLVLRKLVNARRRRASDFADAVGVLRVQGDRFDSGYVRRHCAVHRVCASFEDALKAAAT